MEDVAAQRAAETLLAAHQANLRFEPLRPPRGPATIADAYDIQQRYLALLRRAHGGDAGYKVGLTSAAMQTFCGIDHPIAGVVLAKRVHRSGVTVRRSDFGRLGLEFEIAVRIASDVPVTNVPHTAETIAAQKTARREERFPSGAWVCGSFFMEPGSVFLPALIFSAASLRRAAD